MEELGFSRSLAHIILSLSFHLIGAAVVVFSMIGTVVVFGIYSQEYGTGRRMYVVMAV